MKKKPLNILLHPMNHEFLQDIKREIMLEDCENVSLAQIIETSLIEFRNNNSTQEMKEKIVHSKRLGIKGLDEYINNL